MALLIYVSTGRASLPIANPSNGPRQTSTWPQSIRHLFQLLQRGQSQWLAAQAGLSKPSRMRWAGWRLG